MISVVHVCANTGGGAGRAAVRTHVAATRGGLKSTIVCLRDAAKVAGTIALNSLPPPQADLDAYDQFKKKFIDSNRTSISSTVFHPGFVGHDISALDPILESDVIHLHWINDFLRPTDIAKLLELKKPIVWTLHDYWPITGGCHFPAGCEGFKNDCSDCLQLRHAIDLPAFLLADKVRAYGGAAIRMTAPSTFMASEISKSALFRGAPATTLPNAVDTSVFSPVSDLERTKLRAELAIKPDDLVLMISAQSLREKRKGFVAFLNAVRVVAKRDTSAGGASCVRRVVIVATGHHDLILDADSVRLIRFPHVDDDHVLAKLMQLSDFFVHPAQEETFGLGVMEAMACGTPAVVFDNGGSLDFVRDGANGVVLGPNQDVGALVNWIRAARSGSVRASTFRQAARATAEQFSLDRLSGELSRLYAELAENAASNGDLASQGEAQGASTSFTVGKLLQGLGAAQAPVGDLSSSPLAELRRDDHVVQKTVRFASALKAEPLPPHFARALQAEVAPLSVKTSNMHLDWVPRRLSYTVEKGVCGEGWHWFETVRGKPARWMNRVGKVRLAGPFETPATLTIHGLGHVGEDVLSSLRVLVGSNEADGDITVNEKNRWIYEAVIDVVAGSTADLDIEMRVRTTKQPPKDPRQLSLLVTGFELKF